MGRAEDLFAALQARGDAYIAELIATRAAEEAFLDFKRSADDGAGTILHDDDRANLARCLSGFANSDGGVILWGVNTQRIDGRDGASGRQPLVDAGRFASLLDGAMSGCTVPAVTGARSVQIGQYVATLIPQSAHAPHQITKGARYYIRSGSSFQPATHSVLSGMFGRLPRANVIPTYKVGELTYSGLAESAPLFYIANLAFQVVLVNDSAVVASEMYLTCHIAKACGDTSIVQCDNLTNADRWTSHEASDRDLSLVAMPHTKLAPRGRVAVMECQIQIQAPITESLEIRLTVGASGAPPTEEVLGIGEFELERAYIDGWERWVDTHRRPRTDWYQRAAALLSPTLEFGRVD